MAQSNAERQKKWRERRDTELKTLRVEVRMAERNPALDALSQLAYGDGAGVAQILDLVDNLGRVGPVVGAAQLLAHFADHCEPGRAPVEAKIGVDVERVQFLVALGRLLNSFQLQSNGTFSANDIFLILKAIARAQMPRDIETSVARAGNAATENARPQRTLLEGVAKILAGQPLTPEEAAKILEIGLGGSAPSELDR